MKENLLIIRGIIMYKTLKDAQEPQDEDQNAGVMKKVSDFFVNNRLVLKIGAGATGAAFVLFAFLAIVADYYAKQGQFNSRAAKDDCCYEPLCTPEQKGTYLHSVGCPDPGKTRLIGVVYWCLTILNATEGFALCDDTLGIGNLGRFVLYALALSLVLGAVGTGAGIAIKTCRNSRATSSTDPENPTDRTPLRRSHSTPSLGTSSLTLYAPAQTGRKQAAQPQDGVVNGVTGDAPTSSLGFTNE